MRVHRTLLIGSFILSIFVQTNTLSATQHNDDLQALTNTLTAKTKAVVQQGEENLQKAVSTLSQKKFILKNQAAVSVAETQAVVTTPKLTLWQKMINAIAEPLVPLFVAKDIISITTGAPVSATTKTEAVAVVKNQTPKVAAAPAPVAIPVPVVKSSPRVISQTVIQNVSVSEIAKLRAEIALLNNATLAVVRDLEDAKVNSLARSLDRSFSPVIQQINNLVNGNNSGGSFNFSETVDGLDYAGGVLSTTVGYTIPLTASTSEWGTFYQTPSSRITAGANCAWVGNTFNCTGGAASATTTINGTNGSAFTFATGTSGTDFNIATSSGTITFNIPDSSASARGLLSALDFARIPLSASSTNWNSFYNTPSTRITAGANLAWVGNTLGFNGVLPIANGGTATSAVPTYGKLLMGNAGGTYDLVATSSLGITGGGSGTVSSGTLGQAAFYGANGTVVSGTSTLFISTNSSVGIGTTTPGATLAVTGTILGQAINTYGTGTSTFGGGINIVSGCYAINGTCIGGAGGSGTVGSGTTGQFPYYAANGTTLTATSTLFMAVDGNIGIGTVSPSNLLHVRKDQNAGTISIVQNNTSGTGAFAQSIYQTASDSFQVGISSAAYTPGVGTELFGQNTSWLMGSSAGGVNMVASNASGVIRFGTGGTATANERMRITSAGLVGIGTTSPAYKLTVAGDINYTGSIYKDGVLQTFGVTGSGTTGQFPYYAANGTALTATSTLFMSAVGNIGIGTASPSYSLHVRRDQNAGTVAMVQNSTSGTGAFAQAMYQTASDSFQVGLSSAGYTPGGGAELFGQNTAWMIGSSAGGVNMVASNASGVIRFGTGGYATANERMRITSTGLVGIGTTSPANALSFSAGGIKGWNQSSGGIQIMNNFSGGNSTIAGFANNTASDYSLFNVLRPGGAVDSGDFQFYALGPSYASSGLYTSSSVVAQARANFTGGLKLGAEAGPLSFFSGGSALTDIGMTLTTGKNVGIGITTPSALMHIYRTSPSNNTDYFQLGGGTVAHGITDLVPTATYASIGPADTAFGGMFIAGYADDAIAAVIIDGNNAIAPSSVNTSVSIRGWKKSGTGRIALTGTEGVFSVSAGGNTPAFRVLANGNIGVGTTTPTARLTVGGTSGSTDNLFAVASSTGVANFVITSAGLVGIGTTSPAVALAVVGNAQFTAVTSGAYASDLNITSNGTLTTSASDIRLKENITEISTSTLDRLRSLKAYTFNWKADPEHRTDVGLIAQEVEFVFPELVFTNKTDGFKGVNYSRLSIFLLKGIQEQQVQLDELKKYTTVLKLKEVHTEKLCVGSESDEVCITREDLRNLLQGHAAQGSGGGSSGGGDTPAPTPTEPTDTGSSTAPIEPTEEDVVPPTDTPDAPAEIPAPTPEPIMETTPTPETLPDPAE